MLTKSRLAKGNYLDMGVSNHRGQTKIHWFPNFNSTCFKHFGWVPNVEMIYPCWVLPNTEKKHWIPWNLITDPFLIISDDHFPTMNQGSTCLIGKAPRHTAVYNPYRSQGTGHRNHRNPYSAAIAVHRKMPPSDWKDQPESDAARRPGGLEETHLPSPVSFRYKNC